MARISEVIHVKYNGTVQECALFSASSDIPSPATAREFGLNGAKVYGAVISDQVGSEDGKWVLANNGTPLWFYVPGADDTRVLLTTPYFVRPLVDSITVGADGGTFAMDDLISTNGIIIVVGTPDTGYVTTSESGVTVSANTGAAARSFTVDVIVRFADGSTQDIELGGTQEAAADSISVSPTSWSADARGGSTTVQVTATAEWSVSTIPSWLTVSPTGGQAGTTAVTITASANTGSSSRSGSVDFAINATGKSATLTVSQGSGRPSITRASDENVYVSAGTNSVAITLTPDSFCSSVYVTINQWAGSNTGAGAIGWRIGGGSTHTSNGEESVTADSSCTLTVLLGTGRTTEEIEVDIQPRNGDTTGTSVKCYIYVE